MAAWENDNDIARDLDALSGFKSSTGKVKSYTSWGRGQNLQDGEIIATIPFQENKPCEEEFDWFQERQTGKLPDSLSRGKKLEILKENCFFRGKESEVQEQLRAAMGPGYSNELIEATFKQRMGHIGVNGPAMLPNKQFADSEIEKSDMPENITLETPEISSKNVPVAESIVNKKSKRKGRRYRNAVLESLEKLNNSPEVMKNSNDMTTLMSDHSFHVKQTGESTLKNIPPACYVPYKRKTNSFEYSDADFPKL